ncbi:MAG: methyltransferase domain-containing protein [Chloroflexi bacterium]|nr:methyltransferase domain-containing protein [Chloroflexota bacterium]
MPLTASLPSNIVSRRSRPEQYTPNNKSLLLHIGAGKRKIVGAITLDINPRTHPDVVWDLNSFPYPFNDSTFGTVVCEHVLEHLDSIVQVMEELHRITQPQGRIWIRVPYFTSLNFNTDPTHTHAFSSRSFDYLCLGTGLVNYDYSTVRFRKLVARMTMRPLTPANRTLMRLINLFLSFYEEHLAYIIPGQELLFVLEVVK